MAGVLTVLLIAVACAATYLCLTSRDDELAFKTGAMACVFWFLALCASWWI